jgi:Predicted SAM-dependent methyltransferase
MDAKQLSKRLATVAKYVPEHARMADIGSDHAYLPAFLALQGKISFAVAGEVVKGPYENAVHEIKSQNLDHVITHAWRTDWMPLTWMIRLIPLPLREWEER